MRKVQLVQTHKPFNSDFLVLIFEFSTKSDFD